MLKIGLIGCGFMGGMHSACYKVIENVQVVAVADVRREKAEEIAKVHGAQIFASGKGNESRPKCIYREACLHDQGRGRIVTADREGNRRKGAGWSGYQTLG